MSLPLSPLKLLPTPRALSHQFNRHMPLMLKRKLLEPQFNLIFTEYLEAGDFELLEGRYISLKLRDIELELTFTLVNNQLRLVDQPGEATILGDMAAFMTLARKEEDADGLFFQRRIQVEGDTELGLGVKNLLDSIEWSVDKSPVGKLLLRMEHLYRTRLATLKPFRSTASHSGRAVA
ncbi:ubiquinone anaerobic biosynthesis accessory factor UbiT [Nitrincola alkalilacustris]|uniref:ubiquinone anaerobic biosynthesis accessory factor UbiT n=1 Tax=Nitrincola alkalilacustris TaxID=1571224 RepID=UPI00124E0F63|nr:SCP2 sterol-binding domain-containing protein [Nitrincola alkalilacustris]